ncbi:MAG: glycogen synthase [Thermoanaerobaculia bacterium]
MRILFLAAEAAPYVKVGGLADVAGSLPKALRELGHDVRLAIPGYVAIDWERWRPEPVASFPVPHRGGAQKADVYLAEEDVYFVCGPPIPMHRGIYGSSIAEDGPKFLFFSLAALWTCGTLGWRPDIVHANDWHTAAAVYWLAGEGRRDPFYRSIGTLLTIHNLPHMGKGAGAYLGDYGLTTSPAIEALPQDLRDSMLGLGIVSADFLSTVSPTYAREIMTPEGGHGLDGVLRARGDHLAGVVNGIDTKLWNPATDRALAERFDADSLEKRAVNKSALQHEAGLARGDRIPLAAVVSRLDSQKGLDIAVPPVRRWLAAGGQLVLLGTGDSRLEQEFAAMEMERPGQASVRLRFDAGYAHRIYAGADLVLIPSRYEPCGLTQMIAMRYGAIPVARRTGGLADTVTDAGDPDGTGLMFDELRPEALWDALERALAVYADAARWSRLQTRGMQSDFSWRRSARSYEELYRLARASHPAEP